MSHYTLPEGDVQIAFSGGRTSAYMLHEAQRQSWLRAFEPCEHGIRDWETCPDCLSALKQERPE